MDSKPVKTARSEAMKNHSYYNKLSDGDWNVAKGNRQTYFKMQKKNNLKQNDKIKTKPSKEIKISVPSKPVWKAKNVDVISNKEHPRRTVNNLWFVDSGCSRHMTRDISLLHDVQNFNGGYVSFAGGKGGKISMKAESDAMLWHRRLGHVNLKNLNRIAKGNHFRDLPISEFFSIEKCVTRAKGKQHRKPHKLKMFNSIDCILHLLPMDLFGPVNVMSIGQKSYCLLIKNFIVLVENQRDVKVKAIRCDNGTEFKNAVLNQFCAGKGIARQFSAARTPQQNGVAERKNITLIEATRTMLSESKLPFFFWAEAINTACYVLNQVLLNKKLQMTPYEVVYNEKPRVGYFRAFGCLCTVLHTESTPKFNEKADECYFVGFGSNTTTYRVYNKVTKEIRESTYVDWKEQNPTDAECGPSWLFDYHSLFKSFNICTDEISGSPSETFDVSDDDEDSYIGPLLTVDPPEVIRQLGGDRSASNAENVPVSRNIYEDSPANAENSSSAVDDGITTHETTNSSIFQEPIRDESMVEKPISDPTDESNDEIQ
ncbi:hypothetical protein L1987_54425 [Smallanthus sonchifolius]|uniref:Uncharacterized protein n=1 Tax=Smallanthus sonchifolius TaxID=185202 RepID=A0ACB9E7R8_9ASTR|nr:hypothetical protein L1987_54425 [Smallanthus sonchifolius]